MIIKNLADRIEQLIYANPERTAKVSNGLRIASIPISALLIGVGTALGDNFYVALGSLTGVLPLLHPRYSAENFNSQVNEKYLGQV